MDSSKVQISYKGVDISQKSQLVLSQVSFEVKKGEFVYLVGKVGTGKSSLMKTMYAELPIEVGQARVLDFDVAHIRTKDIHKLRKRLGIVFQDFQLLTDRNVTENLQFVLKATGWNDKHEIADRMEEVLRQVGLENKGYKMPHELSGGEQQRVAIARALLNEPEIILADEPTGNLDGETGDEIMQLLHTIAQAGTTIIMSTHNLEWVKRYKARTLRCEDGKLIDQISETNSYTGQVFDFGAKQY